MILQAQTGADGGNVPEFSLAAWLEKDEGSLADANYGVGWMDMGQC
jgi:hypothetical protein